MKLLNKTSLIILTATLFIFFLGGFAFYRIIDNMINRRVDRELLGQKKDVIERLDELQHIDSLRLITVGKVDIEKMNPGFRMEQVLRDSFLFDRHDRVFQPYRVLQFSTVIDGTPYRISIFRSILEAEKLVEQIVLNMMLMLLTLILVLFFLNRFFFQRIWDDFFNTLNRVKNFRLHDPPNLNLPYSETQEFQTLNEVFAKLTERIHKDYQNLRQFTENASHEIQTPLSVLHSRIELMLQDPANTEEQVIRLGKLNEAVNRLSNINKVLILLARIDNDQFPELTEVNPKERIDYHLGNLREMTEARNLTVECECSGEVRLLVNGGLADILIVNLIKNAIRHNFDGGRLFIRLTPEALEISNTGPALNIPAETLFNRFVKDSASGDSLGLGLSLVKRICDLYDFEVTYANEGEWHTVRIAFRRPT